MSKKTDFTHKKIWKKILSDEFNFKILEVSKRDEKLEEEWVKKIIQTFIILCYTKIVNSINI